MTQIPYIFNQLHSYLPRDKFDRLVKKYNGNAYIINYTCWNHLLVMMWAQLTSRRSLRDIETSIRAHSDKSYRLGFGRNISRNNIAYVNSKRSVAIYREFAQEMMRRTSKISIKDKSLKEIADVFGLNGFFAVDSSTVIDSRPVNGITVLADHTILFCGRWAKSGYPEKLRKVRYYSAEKNEVLDFVTNNFELDAESISLLYRYRWQIELFFKWIKQHLRITSFYSDILLV